MDKPTCIPKLRFPEFLHAGEWKIKKLGKVVSYERPDKYIVKNTNYFSRGIPVLTANKGFILGYTDELDGICENIPAVIFDDFTTDKKYVDFPFKVKSSAIKVLYANKGNNLKFLYELMSVIKFEAKEHKRYYISTYQNISVPVPSLAEQEKIAACLSSIDERITLEKQKLTLLEQHKKGLLQQLFPKAGETLPERRFPEFQNTGEWKIKKLGEVAENIKNGLTIKQTTFNTNNAYKVTRIETISDGVINDTKVGYIHTDKCILEYKLKVGDILLSHINSIEHVGKNAYVDKDYNLYHGMNLLRITAAKEYSSKFIYYLLNTGFIRKTMRDKAKTAVNQVSINQNEIKNLLIIVPSLAEQEKIAACLSSIDELISLQRKKVALLEQYKKGLLQGLFPEMA